MVRSALNCGFLLALALVISPALAAQVESEDCLLCHDGLAEYDLGGAHEAFDCTFCHTSIEDLDDIPHPEGATAADCSMCHERADLEAPVHNSIGAQECAACHDPHRGPMRPEPAEDSCGMCHSDAAEAHATSVHAERGIACGLCHFEVADSLSDGMHELPASPVSCEMCHSAEVKQLRTSVHGAADEAVASCAECHGDHSIVATKERKTAVARSCADCHADIAAEHEVSLHGAALAAENPLAPDCVTCHGGHGIVPSDDPESTVNLHQIPALCGGCHTEGAPVQAFREVPEQDVLENYSLSIHGFGLFKKGLTVTAVCTSCHTSHAIRGHEDEESTIHGANVVATCMQCHAEIEGVHKKVIDGKLWEEEPHKIPVCVDCHQPHRTRRVFYDQGMADSDCMTCHADSELAMEREGRRVPLHVSQGDLAGSMHSGVACAQCHTGGDPTANRSCEPMTDPVDCSLCHAKQSDEHNSSVHGTLVVLGDKQAPGCTDCHDVHRDAPRTSNRSPIFRTNIPGLCASCHREGESAASRKRTTETEIVDHYAMGVHGKSLTESGLVVTAVCTDCHTAHLTLPKDNPNSSIHAENIPGTCAVCHDGIYEKYAQSIHAQGDAPDGQHLPTCYDCHESHAIDLTSDAAFRSGVIGKCAVCHEDVVDTYFETYHGKAAALGSAPAAKCHDCHGAHDILPPSDLDSRLSRDNIVGTCQQCHEGAGRKFAGYLTHSTHHDRDKYPYLFWTFWGMTTLLISVLIGAGIHTALWFWRAFRSPMHNPGHATMLTDWHVLRFSPGQRLMHLIMLLSFFGLAITGMMVKFSYMPWAKALSRFVGGPTTAAYLHRVCAALTFVYFFGHIGMVVKKAREKGWKAIFHRSNTMLPTKNDGRDLKATWRWFRGKAARPQYGRWTYWEKFDYWAVFWGVAVIGTTGLLLWFPEMFTKVLPGEVLNVATIIHSDEALLAVGFIFTVHFFNTHFRRCKFPMDPVIFLGSMPIEEFKWERQHEYEELKRNGGLADRMVMPPSPWFLKAVKVFGITMLCTGVVMVGLILYAMVFAYK